MSLHDCSAKVVRIVGALCLAGLALVAPGATAHAQSFAYTPVGDTIPLWLSSSPSVTNDGDVAWTAPLLPTSVEAKIRWNGSQADLHIITRPTGFTSSFAHDITATGQVAGYFAQDLRQLQAQARMWSPLGVGWEARDLHATLPEGTAISQAYAISNAPGSNWYVAGMTREHVSNATLPQPHVWVVGAAGAGNVSLQMGSFDHGIARAVATSSTAGADLNYACGAVGDSGASYNIAACWDLNDNGSLIIPSFTGAPDHLSSSIERVRVIRDAANVERVYAGGTIIDTDGRSRAVVFRLDGGMTEAPVYPLSLVTNAQTIFGDIAGFQVRAAVGGAVESGVQVVGMSASAAPLQDELLPATPPEVMGLHGAYAWFLPGVNSATLRPLADLSVGAGRAGMIADALASGTLRDLQHTIAISPDGTKALVYEDGTLSVLSAASMPETHVVAHARDLQTRTSRQQTVAYSGAGSTATKIQYHWFALDPGPPAGTEVHLVWANNLQYGVIPSATGACTDAIAGLGGAEVWATTEISTIVGGVSYTTMQGALPAQTNQRYLRAFYEQGGVCVSSPIHIVDAPTQENQSLGSGLSYDSGRSLSLCYPGISTAQGWQVDTDTEISIDHCGDCNFSCLVDNRDTSCGGGECVYGECDPGWATLTPDVPSSPCSCPIQNGGVDRPELTGPFIDQNCDGVDGDAENSIFVDHETGSDSASCGSREAPCGTISHGITRATAGMDVLVSRGTYNESITLKNGVSIYGGYAADLAWARAANYTVTVNSTALDAGHGWAVRGTNIGQETFLNQLTIIAPNATAAGASSYGVRCSNCSGLRLRYVRVTAGSGARGTDGTYVGGNGAGGGSGVAGGGGSDDGSGSPGAKAGGVSTCGRPGGDSGAGGSRGSSTGSPGAHGTVWGSGGGARGDGGNTGSRCGHADGSRGFGGAGGAVPAVAAGGVNGSASGGLWTGASGATGATGNAGHGGGGGGGGTGQGRSNITNWCIHGAGNSGGSGGAGGCPGLGGAAGTAGGGSFAVFLVNSSGAVVANSWLTTSAGGDGGSGMRGGDGGDGGAGGNGGAATDGNEIGWGGGGGGGGGGSGGGGGGGGAGGPSVGIAHTGGAITASANAVVRGASGQGGVGGGISSGGDAGSGGLHSKNGGLSGTSGTAGVSGPAGGNGATGAAQDIWSF